MVDIVKNAASRLDTRAPVSNGSRTTKAVQILGILRDAGDSVKPNSLASQSAVKEMASAAPIDKDKCK